MTIQILCPLPVSGVLLSCVAGNGGGGRDRGYNTNALCKAQPSQPSAQEKLPTHSSLDTLWTRYILILFICMSTHTHTLTQTHACLLMYFSLFPCLSNPRRLHPPRGLFSFSFLLLPRGSLPQWWEHQEISLMPAAGSAAAELAAMAQQE